MESVKRVSSQRYELGKIFRKSSCSGRNKLVSANIRNCRGILYVWLGESWALWADDIKVMELKFRVSCMNANAA